MIEEFDPLVRSEDIEIQTRGVLVHLFRAMSCAPKVEPVPLDVLTCPNCGTPHYSTKSPYCSEDCRVISSFVRQCRHALEADMLKDAERQGGLGGAFWSVIGGGLPRRESLVIPSARKKVLERDGGICQVCHGPADKVENIKGGCNRPINLRAVCTPCGHTKPFTETAWLAGSERLREVAARVAADPAVRPCDDADTWDWRAFLNERKAKLAVSR